MKRLVLFSLYLLISTVLVFPASPAASAGEPNGYDRGLELYKNKDFPEAIKAYTQALALFPDRVEILINRGIARLKTRDYSGSIQDAGRALSLAPDNIMALEVRGTALFHTDQIQAAEADFATVAARSPDQANALKNLGLARLKLGQWQPAETAFSSALATGEGSMAPDILLGRGMARYGQKNWAGAMADFETAMKAVPDSGAACNQTAWMLAVCPDPQFRNGSRALALAQKAIALEPAPETLETLALAQAESGNFTAALAHMNQLMALAEQGSLALPDRVLEKLASIKAEKPWREMPGQATDRVTALPVPVALEVGVRLGRIRTSPSLSSAIAGRVPEGQQVTVLEKNGEWFKVLVAPDLTGWGHKSIFNHP